MTIAVAIMIVLGVIFIFASFFVTENFTQKKESYNTDLFTVSEDYEFSEREKGIIKRKVEDAIAQQARDILYETNESLSNMANEKTMALGDYAVTVCEEIERNHKEVMFLYSMLEDKQKDIMSTVGEIDRSNEDMKQTIIKVEATLKNVEECEKKIENNQEKLILSKPTSAEGNINSTKKKRTTSKSEVKKETVVEQTNTVEVEKIEEEALKEKQMPNVANQVEGLSEQVVAEEPVDEKVVYNNEESEQQSMIKTNDFVEEDDLSFEQLDLDDVDLDNVLEEEFEKSSNSNDIILEMYRNGDNILTIAKELGLGVGEVKLVIDLYQGE